MSTTPPPWLTAIPIRTAPEEGPLGWFRALGPRGRRAFAGAFGGYALDSYDYFTLPLTMVALAAYFHLGATGYGVAALALFGLPETRGRELT